MSHENLVSMIDKIASGLESKGLIKEAEMLDVIANTLENGIVEQFNGIMKQTKPSLSFKDEQYKLYKSALKALLTAAEKVSKGDHNVTQNFKYAREALLSIIRGFINLKKTLYGVEFDTLDLENKSAGLPLDPEKKSVINALDSIIKPVDLAITELGNNDPGDLQESLPRLFDLINKNWIRASQEIHQ